jgi:hypothetical protein
MEKPTGSTGTITGDLDRQSQYQKIYSKPNEQSLRFRLFVLTAKLIGFYLSICLAIRFAVFVYGKILELAAANGFADLVTSLNAPGIDHVSFLALAFGAGALYVSMCAGVAFIFLLLMLNEKYG